MLSENVFANSMKPLKNYIDENTKYYDDPVTLSYIFKRCASVYLFASGITKDKEPKSSESFSKAYYKSSDFAAQVLKEGMKWSDEEVTKNVITDLKNMTNLYTNDGNIFFAKTGKYMMDNYIGEDISLCKGLVEAIN